MLILRIPYALLEIPLLQPELIWRLLGERMGSGYSMYVDITDDNGPLSSGIYWLIHLMAGKSFFAYQLIAGATILFQVAYINSLFIQCKSFEDNTYIPALVMVVLFHISFDFLTLSPALMGTTFVLLALGQLFYQTVRHHYSTESILLVGLFGGIAVCFHFPLVFFLPFVLVAGVMINGFSFHQLVLFLVGYILPFLICALYYFWIDGLGDFLFGFVFATWIIDVYHHASYWDISILFLLPFIFTLIGFVLGSLLKHLTVSRQKQNQLIILFLAFSLLSIILANRKAPYQLVVVLPGLAYFISQIFLYLNRKKLTAILFYIFFFGVPLVGYGWAYHKIISDQIYTYAVNSGNQYDFTKNSKVLVLGKDLGYYRDASLAGPFLNYHLSKPFLKEYKSYENLTAIYLAFARERPEYIIDEDHIFADLLEHFPELRGYYSLEREGIYKLNQP
ncbi:MAG: hypothetical protein WD426_02670 [Anditalea sp.]